jgi:hypothetical protein
MPNPENELDMDQIQREVEGKKQLWIEYFEQIAFDSFDSEDTEDVARKKIQYAAMIAEMMLAEVEKRWQ